MIHNKSNKIYLMFLILMVLISNSFQLFTMEAPQSYNSEQVQWPVLDSSNLIHKRIINSMVNKEKCKFKGKWFTTKKDLQRNSDLFANANQITNALTSGLLVKVKPTSDPETYSYFTKRCAYKIYINNREVARFILRVSEPENIEIPNATSQSSNANDISHIADYQNSIVRIGHGTFGSDVEGYVNDRTISNLMTRTNSNQVLNLAYSIIEAADLANVQDPILLAHYIKHNRNNRITSDDIIRAINHDAAKLEKVRQRLIRLSVSEGAFRDQIKRLSHLGLLKRAANFIRRYPQICNGVIPGEISSYNGGKLPVLRAALFYCARLQNDLSPNFRLILSKLGGFYKSKIYNDEIIKNLLSDTYLTIDGTIYCPANSYVLYADSTASVNKQIRNLPVIFEPNRSTQNLPMCFGDCTGFVSQIVRVLKNDIAWFATHRFKSRDLEIVYDVLVKEQLGSYKYRGVGRSRDLTRAEINRIKNEFLGRPKLNSLKAAFEPVLNRDEIKPGDIIVFRQRPNGNYSTHTGHGVIVVDPRPVSNNSNLVTVVECTRASETGLRHGYGWRNVPLIRGGSWETRVLRIRNF